MLLECLCAGAGLMIDGLQYRNIRQGFPSYSRGHPNVSPCGAFTGDGSASLRGISKLWSRACKLGCQEPASQGGVEGRSPHL